MKLVTVSEMQAIEREANERGLTYELMMENAGRGLAQIIAEMYSSLKEQGVLGLVGSGNNGGDTLVALAILANQGWKTRAYIVRSRPEDDPLMVSLHQRGGEFFFAEQDPDLRDLGDLIKKNGVLLDGILGTGVQLPIRGKVAEVLDHTRQIVRGMDHPPVVVAVDLPSGVECDTGEAAPETIPANLTVTMAAVKRGLLQFPAFGLIGEFRVVNIGLTDEPAWQAIRRQVADALTVQAFLPSRPAEAHKGTFGTALIVGGSANYTGAVLLAGKAAYRIGAGLVTLALPAPLHSALAGHFPEAIWLLLPHEMGVITASASDVITRNLERPTAVLVGPGLGLEDTTRDFLVRLIGTTDQRRRATIGFVAAVPKEGNQLGSKLPAMVVDADGLKLLARMDNWPACLPELTVLTPHPGEMSILTGMSVRDIQLNRLEVAERYAHEWGHVVVLKGAHTVIAAPDGHTTVIPIATPALARAGTGDVLAGLIVGLRAQGVLAYPAAVAAAWIHGEAGKLAEKVVGNTASVLAGDVLEAVKDVVTSLNPIAQKTKGSGEKTQSVLLP